MNSRPANDFTFEQIAQCSNEALADYFGHPIVWTPEELAGAQPGRVSAYRDDLPGHARLAAMGVVPAWAGKGVGSRLLAAVLDAARADGTNTIWLEVITDNTPAIKLYSRYGFQPVRALAGWTREAEPAAAAVVVEKPDELSLHGRPALEEQTPEEVLRLLRQHGAAAAAAAVDLPWQLWHQFALATRPQACRGFRLGSAHCAISDPERDQRSSKDDDNNNNNNDNTVSLLGVVVVPEEARGRGDATALLRAVMARYPGKKWKAPATIPLEYGETIARRLGFTMETIRMDLMKLSLE
ncbi:hypothetical protein MY1884_003355 [Beauveria asiatica]